MLVLFAWGAEAFSHVSVDRGLLLVVGRVQSHIVVPLQKLGTKFLVVLSIELTHSSDFFLPPALSILVDYLFCGGAFKLLGFSNQLVKSLGTHRLNKVDQLVP